MHGLGERSELFRHRIHGNDIAAVGVRLGVRQWRGGADDVAAIRLRLQAHIRPELANLPDQIRRWPRRQRLERILEARSDHALVVAEQDELASAEGAPLVIHALLDIGGRGPGERVSQLLRAVRILPHAQIQGGTGQDQRVVESLLDLNTKPTVDAAIQELEREQVNDEQRCDDERAEDAHRAGRQARAGNVFPVLAHELPDLACEEYRQRNHADDVDQQNPGLQPDEFGGVLHALGEQEQRPCGDRSPKHEQRRSAPAAPRAWLLAQTGSDHEYHSLSRCQSLVQKSSTRSDEGSCPRRTPARTLTT